MSERFHCPCCGYPTLPLEPPGSYTLCDICDWEDDQIQFHDPDYEGGANAPSLNQARRDFEANGGKRAPTDEERRNRATPRAGA